LHPVYLFKDIKMPLTESYSDLQGEGYIYF